MNSKAIKWGIGVLILAFIFLWITVYMERPEEGTGVTILPPGGRVATSTDRTYTGSEFSVNYPEGYTVSTSSDNGLFANGISFIVPIILTEGTNLSADSRIYIEATSTPCETFIFKEAIKNNVAPPVGSATFGANTYMTLISSDAGAGNFYRTDLYAIEKNSRCYVILHFVHTTNMANYDLGTIKMYDSVAVEVGILKVLESFKITTS